MKKKGRPKNIENRNNRMHTVVLTRRAEIALRQIKKKRLDFDFSRFVSECILNYLEDDESLTRYYKHLIDENNKRVSELQEENTNLAGCIFKLQNKDIDKKIYK